MTIKQRQWQMYYLGYYDGEIDGIWGKGSKTATAGFQKDNDLGTDGIFGTQTIAKSTEIIQSIQKVITDGKIAIDGLAGLETKDATIQWQAEHALTPDGIAGINTRAKIVEELSDANDDWWNSIRYFSRKEFACKCGRYCDGYPAQIQRGVVELADRAREELKGVCFVSSGLRCPRIMQMSAVFPIAGIYTARL